MAFDFRLPEYMRSTDFKVFEGLFKILSGAIKFDIDEITDLKDVLSCPEHMLELLANSIGCPYFTETSPKINREIIRQWWWMMRNKGTIDGLQTATSLGLMAYDSAKGTQLEDIMYGRSVDILVDQNTGEIYIRVVYQTIDEDSEKEQYDWIYKFIEYVRPAGFRIEYIPSQFTKAYVNMIFKHQVEVRNMKYRVDRHSAIPSYTFTNYGTQPHCFGLYGFSDKSYRISCNGYADGISAKILKILGRSYQEISENLPSIDSPIDIVNVGDSGVISIKNNNVSALDYEIEIPLSSLPGENGNIITQDYIDTIRNRIIYTIKTKVLDGTESWTYYNNDSENYAVFYYAAEEKLAGLKNIISNKLPTDIDSLENPTKEFIIGDEVDNLVYICILKTRLDNWDDSLESSEKINKLITWLTTQSTSETPLYIKYQLDKELYSDIFKVEEPEIPEEGEDSSESETENNPSTQAEGDTEESGTEEPKLEIALSVGDNKISTPNETQIILEIDNYKKLVNDQDIIKIDSTECPFAEMCKYYEHLGVGAAEMAGLDTYFELDDQYREVYGKSRPLLEKEVFDVRVNKTQTVNIKDMETGEVSTFDNEYVERISDTELETHDTMLEEQRVNDMNNDGEV